MYSDSNQKKEIRKIKVIVEKLNATSLLRLVKIIPVK